MDRLAGFWQKLKRFGVRRGWMLFALGLVFIDLGHMGWDLTYNPKFACNLCHNVRPYVESYYSSENLDHVHMQANVNCKDCHQVSPIKAAGEAVTYLTGQYDEPMREADFPQQDCLQCHRSYQSLAERTADLDPNPHDSHLGEIDCTLCHKSHQESRVYCVECHQIEMSLTY